MSYQPVWFDGREPQLSPADLDLPRIHRTHAELTASGHVVVDTMTANGFQAVYYKKQPFGQQSLEARYKSGLITDHNWRYWADADGLGSTKGVRTFFCASAASVRAAPKRRKRGQVCSVENVFVITRS